MGYVTILFYSNPENIPQLNGWNENNQGPIKQAYKQ